jgi:hypothetical protein
VVLHDQEGHPVLVTTHRGDQHLTIGLPAILTHYEQAAGMARLKRIVVAREGMSAEFLAQLSRENGRKYVMTPSQSSTIIQVCPCKTHRRSPFGGGL